MLQNSYYGCPQGNGKSYFYYDANCYSPSCDLTSGGYYTLSSWQQQIQNSDLVVCQNGNFFKYDCSSALNDLLNCTAFLALNETNNCDSVNSTYLNCTQQVICPDPACGAAPVSVIQINPNFNSQNYKCGVTYQPYQEPLYAVNITIFWNNSVPLFFTSLHSIGMLELSSLSFLQGGSTTYRNTIFIYHNLSIPLQSEYELVGSYFNPNSYQMYQYFYKGLSILNSDIWYQYTFASPVPLSESALAKGLFNNDNIVDYGFYGNCSIVNQNTNISPIEVYNSPVIDVNFLGNFTYLVPQSQFSTFFDLGVFDGFSILAVAFPEGDFNFIALQSSIEITSEGYFISVSGGLVSCNHSFSIELVETPNTQLVYYEATLGCPNLDFEIFFTVPYTPVEEELYLNGTLNFTRGFEVTLEAKGLVRKI